MSDLFDILWNWYYGGRNEFLCIFSILFVAFGMMCYNWGFPKNEDECFAALLILGVLSGVSLILGPFILIFLLILVPSYYIFPWLGKTGEANRQKKRKKDSREKKIREEVEKILGE